MGVRLTSLFRPTSFPVRKGTIVGITVVSMAAALVACNSGPKSTAANPEVPTSTSTTLDPDNFALPVDNPYFPLEPGTVFRHSGVKEGSRAVDVFTVSRQTKTILGIPNTVVIDKLFVDGRLEEVANDWYSQDLQGDVWYFGETTQEFDRKGNQITAQGAWEAGVDGARPGIVMPAHPKVGDEFRPEYYQGTAEDRYRILDLSAKVTTPYGSFSDVLVMSEQSRLEPGVLGLKYHARGFGQIKESVPRGPQETLSLVSVSAPS